jgi:hypothetical protein
MKTKFTAGPWEAEFKENKPKPHADDPGYYVVEGAIFKPQHSDEPEYGSVVDSLNRHHCITPEEDRANAFLIAAAPELYAALEKFAQIHRNDMCLCQPINRICAPCRAKNALAKARGEQP